jgi:hypothetical protein
VNALERERRVEWSRLGHGVATGEMEGDPVGDARVGRVATGGLD